MDRKEMIINGRTALGIEFGSTRIKAVLIGEDHSPIASGSHEWENQYENNIWTYSLDMVWKGLQDSYSKLAEDVEKQYGVALAAKGIPEGRIRKYGFAFCGKKVLIRESM